MAEDESRRARCFFVGTEHLFLAIAGKGDIAVTQLLASHKTTPEKAVESVRRLIHRWEPGDSWSGLLRHTQRLKKISQKATYLAERKAGQLPDASHFLTALLAERTCHTTRAILSSGKPKAPPAPLEQTEDHNTPRMEIHFDEANSENHQDQGNYGRRTALQEFGRDITQLAEEGKLVPLIGRETEMRMLMRTLTRQSKPNPIIIGEPGTGKTALIEGLAQQILTGEVPKLLKDVRIVELSLTSLVAGTQYRGEFEKRVEAILAEVAQQPELVLFLDEFHLAVGAGAAGGGMDVANILKPALARGELRFIAATTLREYRKYIEPDSALSRRFQTIILNEPDTATTIDIVRGIKSRLEEHHGVSIDEQAILAAVQFSGRYESGRQQPDKSIDLLDDACTRVTLQSVNPLEESDDDIDDNIGNEDSTVTVEHIARAVADRTGIRVGSLTTDEFDQLATLEDRISSEILGQTEAVKSVVDTLRQMRLSLHDDKRPQSVFLFAGSTGIGKTALAEILAKEYFGLSESLIRIDLSEYMDAHNVSRLIGAPPGFVGHDEQGQLTKALRTRPFSLVLLDEIEKAHPQVCDIFLQVFGSGRLTDGRGEVIDCQQAMFVMTTNLGAESYDDDAGFGFRPDVVSSEESKSRRNKGVMDACRKHFRAEFLNRIDRIVCFNAISEEILHSILKRLIDETIVGLKNRNVSLEVSKDVIDAIVHEAGTKQGVPPLKRFLRERILNRIAELMVVKPLGGILEVKAIVQDDQVKIIAK